MPIPRSLAARHRLVSSAMRLRKKTFTKGSKARAARDTVAHAVLRDHPELGSRAAYAIGTSTVKGTMRRRGRRKRA